MFLRIAAALVLRISFFFSFKSVFLTSLSSSFRDLVSYSCTFRGHFYIDKLLMFICLSPALAYHISDQHFPCLLHISSWAQDLVIPDLFFSSSPVFHISQSSQTFDSFASDSDTGKRWPFSCHLISCLPPLSILTATLVWGSRLLIGSMSF